MEWVDGLRYVGALGLVIGTLVGIAWASRRWDLSNRLLRTQRGGARLHVDEVLYLDAKHKLMLVRRDQTQHLVLLSPGVAPCVIESGVHAPADLQSGVAPVSASTAKGTPSMFVREFVA